MSKNILVFSGGIAGLTVAHELINKGFNVTVVEKDNILGGMARSRRETNNIPSEHSWRGYAPFYNNAFDIMKQILLNNNLTASAGSPLEQSSNTVYENLSTPIEFFLMRDISASYDMILNCRS